MFSGVYKFVKLIDSTFKQNTVYVISVLITLSIIIVQFGFKDLRKDYGVIKDDVKIISSKVDTQNIKLDSLLLANKTIYETQEIFNKSIKDTISYLFKIYNVKDQAQLKKSQNEQNENLRLVFRSELSARDSLNKRNVREGTIYRYKN